MRRPTTLLACAGMALVLSACSTFPLVKHTVKDDHFRFENITSSEADDNYERIYLMCHNQQPEEWAQPRQYEAGKHNLWLKVLIRDQDRPMALRRAYANFKVNLAPGTSYMPNRRVEGHLVHLWIQESDTGIRVSEIVTTELEAPWINNRIEHKARCKGSSV
ncbi:hypothetical protein ACFSJY_09385 [Thalassotalea euphylliae]|uniref:hypothetical protein n=1 Tax=Thalassotalea euphylliae TaxID=1655234 RepID=UPI00363DBCA1